MSESRKASLPAEFMEQGYVLLSRLGRGSSSEVFEAQQRNTDRRVALKVSLGDIPDSKRVAARLQTAWNVGRGLRHPHLVATLDSGTLSDGRVWLAMERLVGRDLQEELDASGRLPINRAVRIARQLFEALMVLHQRGAIHRDVKPENVFLCRSGQFADHIKLIDMGVIGLADDDPHRAHENTGPVIMGTPLYIAPELAVGERPSPASDLYSAAGVLYHLLTGRPPYPGTEPTAVIKRHLDEPIPQLDAELNAPLPLMMLLRHCMAKSPKDRPVDASYVVVALDRISGTLSEQVDFAPAYDEAQVPQVPAAGVPADWQRFADELGRNIAMCWRIDERPGPIREGMEWMAAARAAVEAAEKVAAEWRNRADARARHRIEAQGRLENQRRQVESALTSSRETLVTQQAVVHTQIEARDALEAEYREAVQSLADLGAGPVGTIKPTKVVPALAMIRRQLAARAELNQVLVLARQSELEAAEQVALLLAEDVEVRRVSADLALEEEDEGQRAELCAARAVDEVVTAQRAFENAALNVYARFVQLAVGA